MGDWSVFQCPQQVASLPLTKIVRRKRRVWVATFAVKWRLLRGHSSFKRGYHKSTLVFVSYSPQDCRRRIGLSSSWESQYGEDGHPTLHWDSLKRVHYAQKTWRYPYPLHISKQVFGGKHVYVYSIHVERDRERERDKEMP